MSNQEEIYKLKYLKYKKKYLDLQSKIGAGGFAAASQVRRMQEDAARKRREREEKEAEAKAKRLAEEARFNALPEEEKQKILQERREAEERRQARIAEEAKIAEENRRIKLEADKLQAEPLIKQINDLHTSTVSTQCGFTGCRNINSNIKKINDLLNQIREINYQVADEVTNKLNESTEKQKKCNCITLF